MTTDLCRDCEWMKRDNDMRPRCYSPQLTRMRLAGISCVFERDDACEPERSHTMGTGKCGQMALNFRKREAF